MKLAYIKLYRHRYAGESDSNMLKRRSLTYVQSLIFLQSLDNLTENTVLSMKKAGKICSFETTVSALKQNTEDNFKCFIYLNKND